MASAISLYVLAMAPCSCMRHLNNLSTPMSFFELAFAVCVDFLVGFGMMMLLNYGRDELLVDSLACFLGGWEDEVCCSSWPRVEDRQNENCLSDNERSALKTAG